MNTSNNNGATPAGRASIRLEGFPNEETARAYLQLALKPELAQSLTRALRTQQDSGAFEADWTTSHFLNADRSKTPEQLLKNTLTHGLLTGQIAITDRIELTDRASPSFFREVSGALQNPPVLSPKKGNPHVLSPVKGISARRQEERIFLDEKLHPTVVKLMKQIEVAKQIISGKYDSNRGLLGNPVSEVEYGAKDSFYRKYEHGAIYLSPNGAVHEVHGAIYQKYLSLRAEAGFLGLPETDEQSTVLGTGRFNHFKGGSIYWTADTRAWEIHGAIRDKWWQLDGDRSHLGYPISDEEEWADPNAQSAGRISHFQRGSIIFRSSDSTMFVSHDSVILTTYSSASSVTCSAELWMNSAGDWRYRGHMHNSGFVGFNVTVVSTPLFQDSSGRIFAPNVERHVDGTTSFEDERSDDWDQVGSGDAFIRENWDFIRFAGIKTVLDVNVTFGDIVQLVAVGFPIAVVAFIVGAILSGGQVCGPYASHKRDPRTGEDQPSFGFEVRGANENCSCP